MKRENKKLKEPTNGAGCLPFFVVVIVITAILFMGKSAFKKDFNYFIRGEADIKGFFSDIKNSYLENMTYPDFIMPLSGNITSPFGNRIHPITNTQEKHTGIDIDINAGYDVKASSDGEIIKQATDERLGNYIIIKHKGSYFTCYAHLDSFKSAEGEYVKSGDIIGVAGSSGQVTGPHLHFEIRKGEERVDPLKYITEESAAQ